MLEKGRRLRGATTSNDVLQGCAVGIYLNAISYTNMTLERKLRQITILTMIEIKFSSY